MIAGGLAQKSESLLEQLHSLTDRARRLRQAADCGDRRAQAQLEDFVDAGCRPRLRQMRAQIVALLGDEEAPPVEMRVKYAGGAAGPRTSAPAWKFSGGAASAGALLSAPVREQGADFDRRFEVAAEEAGHAIVAMSLGYRVTSAHATKARGHVEISPTPTDPRESVAILVAGPAARAPREMHLAAAGGWDGLKRMLSETDWDLLTRALDPQNANSLSILRSGCTLGMGQVGVHREAVGLVRDALLRHDSLSGAELEALAASAGLDLSPRDPTREPPRFLNVGSL